MPVFQYKAINPDGGVDIGEMEAANEAAVIAYLKQAGQLPVRAEEISTRKRASRGRLRLMDRRPGQTSAILSAPDFMRRKVSFLGRKVATICAMMALNMSWHSPRRALARG